MKPKGLWADFFLIGLGACLFVGFTSYWVQFFGPLREKVDIQLSPIHLPLYTFFSMSRGLLAYALALAFSLICGFWAAKDRVAEKILIPILDIFQSIPILGFLPGVVLLLIGIFKHTDVGLELAAILLMFTSQVWNMTFAVYHSIRTVPLEKIECANAFGLNNWQKIKWIEVPGSMFSLIWNSIMSMAGGWFFLMVNEAFRLGDRDFRIPGLGSYMSVAAARGDVPSMIYAVIAMIGLIVFLDQLLWRPLIVWSQKFRMEETSSSVTTESWVLNLMKRSYIVAFFQKLFARWKEFLQNQKSKHPGERNRKNFIAVCVSRIVLVILLGLMLTALYFVYVLIQEIPLEKWIYLGRMVLLTFTRVLICLAISICFGLPLGLWIGVSKKWSTLLLPILQTGASFPLTLLFPALIYLFHVMGIPLGIGSVILMLLGTGWYILFNVMAGASAIPTDLKEVASSFHFNKKQRFFWLNLPAVFPFLITGIVSASGGAWNASIVAEYVTYRDKVVTTPGLGSAISIAAQNNDFPTLAAAVLVMALVVVLINYNVWLRLYHYSEKRFALNV